MKKQILLWLLLAVVLTAGAVPAQRGIWKYIRLADGNRVRVELCGDEHLHFWRAADGTCYMQNDGDSVYHAVDRAALETMSHIKTRGSASNRRIRHGAAKIPKSRAVYTGKKRGLIILAEFKDKSFQRAHDKQLYLRIANEAGFTSSDGFRGSVSDYFKAQSGGLFDLKFDIVGPVRLPEKYAYYGRNNDEHAGEMIARACLLAADSVNFADYDWDGDGEVEQVFVLYAGHGEASWDDANTIWPHKWVLSASDYRKNITIDGVIIDTYACSSELGFNGIDGIGTICHEFTHCLGLPDFYDTGGKGHYGMGSWDLMSSGCYNQDGFIPAGYTSYEKMFCGWLTPKTLTDDTSVDDLKALSDGGDAYMIYNDQHRDEFYLLENRQPTAWDAALPGRGLLVLHVDYDATAWVNNVVNATGTFRRSDGYTTDFSNNHQRLTIFHADNDDDHSHWDANRKGYTKVTESTDPYPSTGNDSLCNTSTPATRLFNANASGSKYMNKAIKEISQNSDGTIAFRFISDDTTTPNTLKGDTIFYESFDRCKGTGGNDQVWGGTAAGRSTLRTDHEGWSFPYGSAYGAAQCAKCGTGKAVGITVTPAITVQDGAVITFRVAPWNTETKTVDLTINGDDVTLSATSFDLTPHQWTTCSATVSGSGTIQFVITPAGRRFFLDDFLVTRSTATDIRRPINHDSPSVDRRIFSLDGHYLGTDPTILKPGIYIRDKKKIIIK